MDRSVPCGCRTSFDAQGKPQSFSRECAEARQLFTRLMQASGSQDQDAVRAELTRHVEQQL